MLRRVSAYSIAVIAVLSLVGRAAAADNIFIGSLPANAWGFSGYNYYSAEDDYKDSGSELLGMQHTNGSGSFVGSSATYIYADTTMLGIGGYLQGAVYNNAGIALYTDAHICIC